MKLISDIINKNLKTSEILMKKDIEVGLYNKSGILMAALVLSSSKVNRATKE